MGNGIMVLHMLEFGIMYGQKTGQQQTSSSDPWIYQIVDFTAKEVEKLRFIARKAFGTVYFLILL